MNSITDIMIGTVRAQACGSEYILKDELTAEEQAKLYALSKAQDVAHLVASELDRQGKLRSGDEISEKFRKQQLMAVFRYEHINYETGRICDALEKSKIPHILLKGAIIRRYYPEAWMRTSSDVDIYINAEDIERVKSTLAVEMNVQYKGTWNSEHSFFTESGVHIEFHDNLNQDNEVRTVAAFNSVWDYTVKHDGYEYCFEMTDEMFYLYHIAHTAKHFGHGGCGLRFFLDVWLLRHRCEYDEAARDALLREAGLLTFARTAEQLADVWFSCEEHNALTAKAEAYIFSGGIYGSKENGVINKQLEKGGKFGYAMSRVFLPYDNMKTYFPIVARYKWLYPFSHIARWLKIIFRRNGVQNSIDTLKYSSAVDDTRRETIKGMMEELGLRGD